MVDTKIRTLTKALSWKFLGVTLLFLVASALWQWQSPNAPIYIAVIYHSIMIVFYMFHERAWNFIKWGKTKGLFIQMTGMSGAGKSTLANRVAHELRKKGYKIEIIDGDEYRTGLCSDLGFSREDRNTNIRRLGFVGSVLARNNVISIIAAINPYKDIRDELTEYGNVKTVFVNCGLEELKERDTKGLYAKALLPDNHPDKILNFTGVSDPYEAPGNADLVLDTERETVGHSARKLKQFIMENVK